jgi:hypothetical protein
MAWLMDEKDWKMDTYEVKRYGCVRVELNRVDVLNNNTTSISFMSLSSRETVDCLSQLN